LGIFKNHILSMENKASISSFLSSKFKFWSFVSMVLLVFVHGYNLDIRYLQPWSLVDEAFNFTNFTEYLLANGLFRFRIPMLFIISGFLFALHDATPHKQRIRKRTRTLLLPYLLWSAIGLLMVFIAELFPLSKQLILDSHIAQIDDTRHLLHDYKWHEVLVRWIIAPLPYQLWFLRVLFVYNLIYLGLRWCVLHKVAKYIFFPFAIFLWFTSFNIGLIDGEGLLFFSLGVWIQKTNFEIEKPHKLFNPLWWGILFVLLSVLKTYLAFHIGKDLTHTVFLLMSALHKLIILSGLVACWFGLDKIVSWSMNRTWFVKASAFSFIIYALHAPLIAVIITPALSITQAWIGSRLFTFVALPIVLVMCCILVGMALRSAMPKTYKILTGGRGF